MRKQENDFMIRALIQISAAQLNEKPLTGQDTKLLTDAADQYTSTELTEGIRLLLIRDDELNIDSLSQAIKDYSKPLNKLRRFIVRKFERNSLEIKMGDL